MAPTQAPSTMPVTRAPTMARNGSMPAWTSSAKIQAAKPMVGREGQVDLADGDDEDQRHDQEQCHRQRHQDRVVERPGQEDLRIGDDEDRHHHDEDGERAERRAVVDEEAAERAAVGVGPGGPGVGGGGHWRISRTAADGSNELTPLGWATCSMKAMSFSAVSISFFVASSATRPRSSTTKRSAISWT